MVSECKLHHNIERTEDMIRFILVCIVVIAYLVLTIPVLWWNGSSANSLQ